MIPYRRQHVEDFWRGGGARSFCWIIWLWSIQWCSWRNCLVFKNDGRDPSLQSGFKKRADFDQNRGKSGTSCCSQKQNHDRPMQCIFHPSFRTLLRQNSMLQNNKNGRGREIKEKYNSEEGEERDKKAWRINSKGPIYRTLSNMVFFVGKYSNL